MRKRNISVKEIAPAARRREGIRATLKDAMDAWAGSCALVLLFLGSVAYVVFGGTLALEASPVSEPETSIAELAPEPADAGDALRKEIVSARSETETQ